MKIMLLAYESENDFKAREDKAKMANYMGGWHAFSEDITKSGISETSHALEAPGSATVVSVRDGKRTVKDGPFPGAKEQLGGFFILEAPDMKTAEEWAAKCPAARDGFVDVRPAPYLSEGGEQ